MVQALEADMSDQRKKHEIILEFQGELGRFMQKFGLRVKRIEDDDCVFHPSSSQHMVAVCAHGDSLQVQIGRDEHNLLPDGKFTNPESEDDRIETQDLFGRILIHLQLLSSPGSNCA